MALPPLADILALFADNNSGDISAADARSMITDLYNGINDNLTTATGALQRTGGTLTGELITTNQLTLGPTNVIRWRSSGTTFSQITTDAIANLTVDSLGDFRINSPTFRIQSFADAANVGHYLRLAADGQVVVGDNVVDDFNAALAAHISPAQAPFAHVIADIDGGPEVVEEATAQADRAEDEADDAAAAAATAEAAAMRAEAAANTAQAGLVVGEMRWFLEDPDNFPERTGMLRPEGQIVTQADYPELFSSVQNGILVSVSESIWQAGRTGAFAIQADGVSLRLPDVRGYYLKIPLGDDPRDVNRQTGEIQADENRQHGHPITDNGHTHTLGEANAHSHRLGYRPVGPAGTRRYGTSDDPDDIASNILLSFTDSAVSTDDGDNTSTQAAHTHTVSTDTTGITLSAQGAPHVNVRNVWIQPYIVAGAGVADLDLLRDHFVSISDRDAYFMLTDNFIRLVQGTVIAIFLSENNQVGFFRWSGVSFPATYDSTLWIQLSLATLPGTLGLGSLQVSSAHQAITLGDSTQRLQKVLSGQTFSLTTGTQNFFLWQFDPLGSNTIASVNTQTIASPAEWLFPVTTGNTFTTSYTIQPAETGELRVQGWAGSDDTGRVIVDLRFTVTQADVDSPTGKEIDIENGTLRLGTEQIFVRMTGVGLLGGLQTEGIFSGQTVGALSAVTFNAIEKQLLTEDDEFSLAVQDEGTPLTTGATTLNFVGPGVTASGTGAIKTINIPGTSGTVTPSLHNFSISIDSRVDVGTDLNQQQSITFGVTNFASLTALTLVVTTGDNQTLTLPTSDGTQTQTVTLSGIDTSTAGNVTFQLSGTWSGGTVTSNIVTVEVRNLQSQELAYFGGRSVNDFATVDVAELSSADVTGSGSTYTITQQVADSGFLGILSPDNRDPVSVINAVLNIDELDSFTATLNVRTIGGMQYNLLTIQNNSGFNGTFEYNVTTE